MIGIERGILTKRIVTVSLHADTIAYRDRITANGGTISTADLNAIDTFVKSAYTNGWQSYLKDCSPVAGDNLNAAVVKLWYPSGISNKLTLTNVATYSRIGGLQPPAGNTGSAFADTGWIPSAQGMTTASGHLGFYSMGTALSNGADIVAADSATSVFQIQCATSDGNGYSSMFSDNGSYLQWSTASNPATGFYTSDRVSATQSKARRNGATINTVTTVAGSIPTSSVKLFGNTYYGGTSRPCGFYSVGSSGIPDSLYPSFSNAVATLMSALGR